MSRQSTDRPTDHPKLTGLIGAELRALPPLRAPASLQSRVFAELARRQSLPWWRQSFRDWPLAAQTGFALLALGLMHLLLWSPAGPALQEIVDTLRDLAFSALHAAQALASGMAIIDSVARDLLTTLPSRWLLAVAMVLVSSVALLLTSGTLVYRTLHTRS
jgi:hypothetical protein